MPSREYFDNEGDFQIGRVIRNRRRTGSNFYGRCRSNRMTYREAEKDTRNELEVSFNRDIIDTDEVICSAKTGTLSRDVH